MRQWIAERPFLQRTLHMAIIVLVISTLLFLATTLPHAQFRSGNGLFELLDAIIALFEDRSAPYPLIFPATVWDIVSATFWISLVVSLILMFATREGRRHLPRLAKLLIQGLFFAWFVFLILKMNQPAEEVQEAETPGGERADLPFDDINTPDLADRAEDFLLQLPESPSTEAALVVVGILLITGLLAYLFYWWRYRQELKESANLPVDALRARALQTLLELRRGEVPVTDVIRHCYREMTRTVYEQRGVYRERSVTPREFETRLLQAGLPETAVHRLTRLFEQVRYGNATTGEREKREAIDSLERIVATCETLGSKRQRT